METMNICHNWLPNHISNDYHHLSFVILITIGSPLDRFVSNHDIQICIRWKPSLPRARERLRWGRKGGLVGGLVGEHSPCGWFEMFDGLICQMFKVFSMVPSQLSYCWWFHRSFLLPVTKWTCFGAKVYGGEIWYFQVSNRNLTILSDDAYDVVNFFELYHGFEKKETHVKTHIMSSSVTGTICLRNPPVWAGPSGAKERWSTCRPATSQARWPVLVGSPFRGLRKSMIRYDQTKPLPY